VSHVAKSLANAPADLTQLGIEDFWFWAFSDLSDDDLKGIFAEWLVIRLLAHKSVRRVSWANNDIILPNGLRVEVKATAFWQSWKVIGEDGVVKAKAEWVPSSDERHIKFSGLRARNSVGVTDSIEVARYKSDLYVFCFEHEQDYDRWNALDLSQWEFYVLTCKEISAVGTSSISLRKLRELHPPISAAQFKQEFERAVARYLASFKENAERSTSNAQRRIDK
jgi:hypothetical protein